MFNPSIAPSDVRGQHNSTRTFLWSALVLVVVLISWFIVVRFFSTPSTEQLIQKMAGQTAPALTAEQKSEIIMKMATDKPSQFLSDAQKSELIKKMSAY